MEKHETCHQFSEKIHNLKSSGRSFPRKKSHGMDKDEDRDKWSLFHYMTSYNHTIWSHSAFLSNHINSYIKCKGENIQKKENKHFQDKSENEAKNIEEERSVVQTLVSWLIKSLETSFHTVDQCSSPGGMPEILPFSSKQSIANFLSHPPEGA